MPPLPWPRLRRHGRGTEVTRPSRNDSVFDEPHLRAGPPRSDAQAPLDSIWHEPGRESEFGASGTKPYQAWLKEQQSSVQPGRAWAMTLVLSLLAGPLALVSTLMTTATAPGMGFLMVVVIAPLVEELGKVMAPLLVVERAPHRFLHTSQILVCAVSGGLVFAVVENLLYLHVYIPDPTPLLRVWRWTVCVVLHTGCSLVAGLGVARVWKRALEEVRPARLEDGHTFLITAMVAHGAYNLTAILINPLFTGE